MCPPTFQSLTTNSNFHKLNFTSSRFTSSSFSRRWSQSVFPLSRVPDSNSCCRCLNRSSGGDNSDSSSGDSWQWVFGIHETVANAIKHIDDHLSSFRDHQVVAENGQEEEWDWDKWRQHFVEVDEQERIISIFKGLHAFVT